MPTMYTASIANGITFKDFAMRCAKAMGACVTMRGDPVDKPISVFKPLDYNKKKSEKAEIELKRLQIMDIAMAGKEARKEYNAEVDKINKQIKKDNELICKYKSMLVLVEAWQPPSCEHTEFKDFMISQITESIKFDCDVSYYMRNLLKLQLLTGEQYLEKKIAQSLKDILYHQEEYANEVRRVDNRNRWIKQLKESLQ